MTADLDWRNAPAGKLDPELRIRLVKHLIGYQEHTPSTIQAAGEALMRMNLAQLIQVTTEMNMAAAVHSSQQNAATQPLRQDGEEYNPWSTD